MGTCRWSKFLFNFFKKLGKFIWKALKFIWIHIKCFINTIGNYIHYMETWYEGPNKINTKCPYSLHNLGKKINAYLAKKEENWINSYPQRQERKQKLYNKIFNLLNFKNHFLVIFFFLTKPIVFIFNKLRDSFNNFINKIKNRINVLQNQIEEPSCDVFSKKKLTIVDVLSITVVKFVFYYNTVIYVFKKVYETFENINLKNVVKNLNNFIIFLKKEIYVVFKNIIKFVNNIDFFKTTGNTHEPQTTTTTDDEENVSYKVLIANFNYATSVMKEIRKGTIGVFLSKLHFFIFWGLIIVVAQHLLSNNNIIFFKFFYKQMIILSLVYFLFSSFVHLNKTNQHGKYTSQIQRFWKRSYLIFWYLEFFLFGLFIYLTMIHFTESPYFLDWKLIYNIVFDNSINFFIYLFLINILLILNYFLFFYHKYNNNTTISLILLFMLLIFYAVVYYEFSKFFYVLNFFNDSELILKFSQTKASLLVSYSELEIINKTRTLNYYISLFILLKFWHVIFISFHFFFFLRNYLFANKVSIDLAASNYQNFLYLFWFNILSMFMFLKNILIFSSQYSYYWFFVNLNYTNFYYYTIIELINLMW